MEQNKDQSDAAVRGEAVAKPDVLFDLWWEAQAVHNMIVEYSEPGIVPINRTSGAIRELGRAIEAARKICHAEVSARAADAPSEPSELAKRLRSHASLFKVGCEPYLDVLAAADALDSQPTDVQPDQASFEKALKAMNQGWDDSMLHKREDGSYKDEDLRWFYKGWKLASSQPTDGGVRNG